MKDVNGTFVNLLKHKRFFLINVRKYLLESGMHIAQQSSLAQELFRFPLVDLATAAPQK